MMLVRHRPGLLLVFALVFTWAFLPARYLPGNRPGTCGSACTCGCTPARLRPPLRPVAALGPHSAAPLGRIRPALPLWYRIAEPGQHSVFLGRAHYRHALRVPLEEHLLVMSPPRMLKTAFLADVILRYPGPVIATSTKPDIYALTAAVRAGLGPVHVFNPSTSAASPPPSAGPRSRDVRTRPPPSAAPTHSRSPSPRRASRTARSGPPKRVTTCAPTSMPPPWPDMTCAPWPSGSPAPTRTSPSGS